MEKLTIKPHIDLIEESDEKVVRKELWTAKQRQMYSLHYTVSYRGSFKPELPNYFITKYFKNYLGLGKYLKDQNDYPIIFDPFAGRGTTILEANIIGLPGIANDINPMINDILGPLTHPVEIYQIKEKLNEIPFSQEIDSLFENENNRFKPFYHPKTFSELLVLKDFLKDNKDPISQFIKLLALSRLHGHSKGFFSAYSFPQFSVLPNAQMKINEKHGQPEYRPVKELILRKAKSVLSGNVTVRNQIRKINHLNKIHNDDSRNLQSIKDESIDLTITSPPFLNQVDYITDNWLESWFLDIDQDKFKNKLIMTSSLESWQTFIEETLKELYRITKLNCRVVMEVGDVSYKNKKINLDDIVEKMGLNVGFKSDKRFINEQRFTKLSNCFKVENNKKGVNTNRMVVLIKN